MSCLNENKYLKKLQTTNPIHNYEITCIVFLNLQYKPLLAVIGKLRPMGWCAYGNTTAIWGDDF